MTDTAPGHEAETDPDAVPAAAADPAPAPDPAPDPAPAESPPPSAVRAALAAAVPVRELLPAAVAGALGIAGALVGALVVGLLTLLFVLVGGGIPEGSGAGVPTDSVPFPAAVVWLSLLGLFGAISGSLEVNVSLLAGSAGATASFVPVIVLLVAVGAVVFWSHRAETRSGSGRRLGFWLLSLASGLVGAIIALVLAAIARAEVSASVVEGLGFSGAFSVSALTINSVVGPLVVVTFAAALGRWLARDPQHRGIWPSLWAAPRRFRGGTRDLFDYLVVLVVFFVPASLVVAIVAGAAGVWPAGVGVLTSYTIALAHLGGYLVSLGNSLSGSHDQLHSVFTATNGVVWLLLLWALLAAFGAALLIARRRASAPVPLARAWVLPSLAVGASILLGLLVGAAFASGGVSALGQTVGFSASVAPAWWSYLLAGVWAAVVEVLARFVAPGVIARVPALARLRGSTAELPQTAPLAPATKRRIVVGSIVGGSVVLLVVVGAVVVAVLQSTVFSAASVVRGYVDDIAAGRFASAAQADAPVAGGTELLASDNVELTTPIGDIRIGDPTGSGDVRTVPVSFTVDGAPDAGSVVLRSTGRQFVFFDSWEIETGLSTTALLSAEGLDEVTVGGIVVPLGEGFTDLVAYPGVYEVVAPESRWVTAEPVPLAVSAVLGGGASLDVQPSEALVTEVQSQVDALIDGWAATGEAHPAGSPFSLFAWGDVRKLSWTVDEYPTLEVWGLTQFRTAQPGQVTARYEQSGFFSGWTPDEQQVSVWAGGEVRIDGDTVTVTVS